MLGHSGLLGQGKQSGLGVSGLGFSVLGRI